LPGPVDTVRALAALMAEHGLARLIFEGDGCKIELARADRPAPSALLAASEPEALPAYTDEDLLYASAEAS